MTYEEFAEKHGLAMEATMVDVNPWWEGNDTQGFSHWECQFYLDVNPEPLKTYFSMGAAFNARHPELNEVLDAIRMDSYAVQVDFDDWCAEYGYETDSRKAFRTWKQCRAIGNALAKFLGPDAMEELDSEVERL